MSFEVGQKVRIKEGTLVNPFKSDSGPHPSIGIDCWVTKVGARPTDIQVSIDGDRDLHWFEADELEEA